MSLFPEILWSDKEENSATYIVYPQIKRLDQLMFSCSNEKEKYFE